MRTLEEAVKHYVGKTFSQGRPIHDSDALMLLTSELTYNGDRQQVRNYVLQLDSMKHKFANTILALIGLHKRLPPGKMEFLYQNFSTGFDDSTALLACAAAISGERLGNVESRYHNSRNVVSDKFSAALLAAAGSIGKKPQYIANEYFTAMHKTVNSPRAAAVMALGGMAKEAAAEEMMKRFDNKNGANEMDYAILTAASAVTPFDIHLLNGVYGFIDGIFPKDENPKALLAISACYSLRRKGFDIVPETQRVIFSPQQLASSGRK